jgi:hypothetical protein
LIKGVLDSKFIKSIVGHQNIEASYKIFLALFAAFCDLAKSFFVISAIVIIGSFFYFSEKKESYIAAGIWALSFIVLYTAMGLMSTLVVIAERLNPKIKVEEKKVFDLVKLIITESSATSFCTLITSFGEGRYKYCEGYAILSIKDSMEKVLVRKIPITFEEVMVYEYAVAKDRRVGRGVIDLIHEKGSHISIKVPPNSIVFNEQAYFDLAKCTLTANGTLTFESGGVLIYDIQDFTMVNWQNISVNEFYDSLKNLSSTQSYSEASKLIDELSLIKSKT